MKKILLTCLLLITLWLPTLTSAQEGGAETESADQVFIEESGLPVVSPFEVVAALIQVFLGFLGVIFVCLIIYAGFLWMTSAGNDDRISKAKQIITAGIIGLVIVLMAYAITVFVIDAIFRSPTEIRSNF